MRKFRCVEVRDERDGTADVFQCSLSSQPAVRINMDVDPECFLMSRVSPRTKKARHDFDKFYTNGCGKFQFAFGLFSGPQTEPFSSSVKTLLAISEMFVKLITGPEAAANFNQAALWTS